MGRKPKMYKAAIILERKHAKQRKALSDKRYRARQKLYDRTVTTTTHSLECPALNFEDCTC